MSALVTIRVGRHLALTAEWLGERLGRDQHSVRASLRNMGMEPDGWVNARTPVWIAERALAKLRPRSTSPASGEPKTPAHT